MKNNLLIISCSQRKFSTPGLIPAIDLYDGPTYRTLRWLFDFTYQHVAKMLSDLAWYRNTQSKTILYRDGRTPKTVYWRDTSYEWGSDYNNTQKEVP